MGTKYISQSSSGYNSSPPPDDGTQVAANLVTWAGVKTKLADVLKTFAEAINTALVSALDLSARAISSNDTAVATDHWKTLQVTGTTTISLSSAASMGSGYEVGIFNAGTGVVTVTPAGSDTINGLSTSVTVSIKGTKIFRTNQALTGYNTVGASDPQTVTATTGVVTPVVGSASGNFTLNSNATNRWSLIDASAGSLVPSANNATSIGSAASVISSLFVAPAGISINITKRKTADESVTSSTVLQDDNHLLFAIAANEEWVAVIEADIGAGLSSTGFQTAITVPALATFDVSMSYMTSGTGQSASLRSTTSGGSMGVGTAALNLTSDAHLHFMLWILNGANSGNVTLQWAQGTSNGTALTFRKGSFLQATRVA